MYSIFDILQNSEVKLSLLSNIEKCWTEIRRFYYGQFDRLNPLADLKKLQTLKFEALYELRSLLTILSIDFKCTETHIFCSNQLQINFKIDGLTILKKEPVIVSKYTEQPVFEVSIGQKLTEAQQKISETFQIIDCGLVHIELTYTNQWLRQFFQIVIKNKTTQDLLRIFLCVSHIARNELTSNKQKEISNLNQN